MLPSQHLNSKFSIAAGNNRSTRLFFSGMNDGFVFKSRDEKRSYVERMFGEIAPVYDFFNHFLSLGFDYRWRREATNDLAEALRGEAAARVLDIACGTGDFSFEILKQLPSARITGVDITQPMLDLFRKKIVKRGLEIGVERGDVEELRFEDNSIDGITIGFGTRNFTNLPIAFGEIYRVLRPGGVFINLELAKPRVFPMKQLYNFYFNGLLPKVASLLSRHDSAYRYLPDSLRRFPDLEPLGQLLSEAGFSSVRWRTLTAGIVAIHIAVK